MKRKAPAKPQARSFQFVSLTPELAGDNVAKADQRRLVRSNAATFQWSRQRKGGPKSIALEVENHAGLVGDQVTHDTNLSSKPTGTSPDTASNSSKAWKGESKSKTSSPDINTDQAPGPFAIVGQTDDHVTLVPSPQQYTVVSPMDQAGQQLRFNIHYIIPRLVPEIEKGIGNPATDLWVSLALVNPSLYTTWVHCISVYYYALRGQWKQSELLLSTHSRALEALNREMQDPVNACSDSNILAIWALASHGWEKFLPPGHKVPNQGRMKHLQSLDRYSLMKLVPLHLDGLGVLIQMRGGLDQITTDGISGLISYTAIVEATKTLSHPRWPFQSICRTFTPLEGMSASIDPNHPLANLGNGFLHVLHPASTGPINDLLDVIHAMSYFTVLLYEWDLGKDFAESDGQVADQRNLIQYNLMSLPQGTHLQLATSQAQTYEITRLATIVFSLLIIFPLTASTAPFIQISAHLREGIQNINIYAQSPDDLNLITWIVMMGGIAAIGTPDRSWYVSILDTLYSHHVFRGWEQLKAIVERFLWLGSINNVDGNSLWLELVQLHSYKKQFETSQHSDLQLR